MQAWEHELARILLDRLGPVRDAVRGILLFGGLAMGQRGGWTSDVDLLVILDDESCDEDVAEARSRLSGLNPSVRPRGLLGHLFSSLERATGMFSGPFVCRERDILAGRFERIFGTSPFMTKLLAPTGLVLGGVLATSKVIYGEVPRPTPPRRRSLQLVKSLVMCFLLSVGGVLLCPAAEEALKYVLEALKWAIYTTHYYLAGRIRPLKELARELSSWGFFPWGKLAGELLRLREKPDRYGLALLLAPLGVLVLHLKALGRPESLYKGGRASLRDSHERGLRPLRGREVPGDDGEDHEDGGGGEQARLHSG